MIEASACNAEERVPTVHLDLNNKMVKAVKNFKPGQMVKVSLVGKIESLRMSLPYEKEKSGLEGSMCLQIESMAVDHSVKNEIAELFEEDDNG